MNKFENNLDSSSEETINIKEILKKFSGHWYYFILSIIICLFLAFLYNRYSDKVYKVSTDILIRDDNNSQLGVENIMEGMELFSGKTNLENEEAVLKSYTLASRTIKKLNIQMSYFMHGNVQKIHLYDQTPFIIKFDSSHCQLPESEFFIELIDDNTFRLMVKCTEQYTYDLFNDKRNKKLSANLDYEKTHHYNENIENPYFSFQIIKTSFYDDLKLEDKSSYSFIFHSLDIITKKHVNLLNIKPTSKESSVLRLSITETNRRKNIDYINTLAKLYILQGLEEKNEMAINTIRFIQDQITKTSDTLDVIEKDLAIFKERNPNLDIINKDFGAFFQKQKVDGDISINQIHLIYYNELLTYLQNSEKTDNIISPTSVGVTNSELNSLINSLLTLNSEKKKLELSTTKSHPKYQSVLSQISHTKKSIIENLKNLISSTNIAKRNLEDRSIVFNSQINELPIKEKEYVKLKRKFIQSENIVNYLILKEQETTIAKEGTEADHKVLDPAGDKDSLIPISPKNNLNFIISLLLGIGIPVTIISLKDFFNETIRSKSDLTKQTNIPILGVIGNSDKADSLVVIDNPKSVISESFRSLRTNIQYLASDKKNKVITVTSSVGSEGKTFCTSNLSLILASAGYKTVLIGADLRKPKTHHNFNIENIKGLSSYLINQSSISEILNSTKNENLKVITSGPVPPNPSELLNSERMKELITDLKKDFEYIVIDTPPAGLVTDSVITMKFSDINLYVVRHNYTKRSMLNMINNLHDTKQVENINIIINDYIVSSTSYGYGYGYGYGNGYGYYD
jgi:tyrosine-protein kinase Etk/Wzc